MRWTDKKGFWFVFDTDDAFGLAFGIVYIHKDKIRDIQISFLLGYVRIAVGYTF